MDKWIREIQKRANGVLTCGNENIPLDFGPNNSVGGGKGWGEKKEKKEKIERRRRRREKLHLLSSFPGDRTVGFRRSKRESSSSRQELQVETRIGEFRQTPRGRGLSPTWFNSRLKSIQMVLMF